MYRRPKFLEVLHAIREQMSRDVDYDVDLFAEMVRSGVRPAYGPERIIRGVRTRALRDEIQEEANTSSGSSDHEVQPKKRFRKSG